MQLFGGILENNPDDLDSPNEIRAEIREAGGNPMDVDEREEAVFAWSLLQGEPKPRDSARLNAAEAELVAHAIHERYPEVDLNDAPEIEDAPSWYDL